MLIWTASTRSAVVQKANDIKFNHKTVVEFINNEVNECSTNENGKTAWGENCNSAWTSSNIVKYILDNFKLNNPYKIKKPLIQISQVLIRHPRRHHRIKKSIMKKITKTHLIQEKIKIGQQDYTITLRHPAKFVNRSPQKKAHLQMYTIHL